LKTFGIKDDWVFNNDEVSKRERTLAASSPAAAACREAVEGLEAVEGVEAVAGVEAVEGVEAVAVVEAVEGAEAATLASIITGLLIVFTASVTPPGGKKCIQCTQRSLHLCQCKSGSGPLLGNETELKNFDKKIIYLGLKM
jgi:hypothetical protein